MEDSLYEVASMRHFAGLALNDDRIPDESTILQFRHLLARHHLTQGLFEAVEGHLREQGYHLSNGGGDPDCGIGFDAVRPGSPTEESGP